MRTSAQQSELCLTVKSIITTATLLAGTNAELGISAQSSHNRVVSASSAISTPRTPIADQVSLFRMHFTIHRVEPLRSLQLQAGIRNGDHPQYQSFPKSTPYAALEN